MKPAPANDPRVRSNSKGAARPSALPQPKHDPDVVLRPYEVYQQIGALIGLALLQSLSFGILAPMMSIVITEVRAVEWLAYHAWRRLPETSRHSQVAAYRD